MSLDQYEESRPPRRTHFEMIIPRDVRQRMLRKEWEVTQAQIAASVRANIKAKNQRRATINNLNKATKMEELLESASRKVKRSLFFQPSVSKQVEQLNEQMNALETVRANEEMQDLMSEEIDDGDNTAAAAIRSVPAPAKKTKPIQIEEESSDDDGEGHEASEDATDSPDLSTAPAAPLASPPPIDDPAGSEDSPENPQEEQEAKKEREGTAGAKGKRDDVPDGVSTSLSSTASNSPVATADDDLDPPSEQCEI